MFNFQLLALLLSIHVAQSVTRWRQTRQGLAYSRPILQRHAESLPTLIASIRGGNGADEERYSRQVYTLGARAHGLVRSATVLLDGPPSSGLLFECAKNLALAGVGNIVILTSKDTSEKAYHIQQYDDLGQAYGRAARSEIRNSFNDETDEVNVLVEFIRKLNPSVNVTIIKRSELESTDNGVLLSIDRPQQSQILLNKLCRQLDLRFVAVETAGVYGRTFCDFGPTFEVFDVDGETPMVIPLDRIEIQDDMCIVNCIDGERHDVSKGDHIQFQLNTGEPLLPQCVVSNVYGPSRFSAQLAKLEVPIEEYISKVNAHATSFSRVKLPQSVNFLPMDEALIKAGHDGSLFAPCDLDKSFDPIRRIAILACFQALPMYLETNKNYPTWGDEDRFRELVAEIYDAPNNNKDEWTSLSDTFSRYCAAKLTPMQGIIGAIGAQEALKAISGLYNPVTQFLLYDCDELISDDSSLSIFDESGEQSGQAYILGSKLCTKLAGKNLFVVGAGAIGCELLKNLSAMGAGTMKGRVIVTDMDTIEKSNLSRQLLFRDGDIGKFKSKAAEEAVLRFNPSIRIHAYTSRVGDEEYGPFNDTFWANDVNVVLNALDNVEARLYIDGQCVVHEKALIDAGTLGAKGNVQVVIPHQSESYGFSADPPDPSIPVCTLKNFPYAISHTIQWGRDLFQGYFERRPNQANVFKQLLQSNDVNVVAQKLINGLSAEAAVQAARELKQDLKYDSSSSCAEDIRQDAIDWAAMEAKRLFFDAINALLKEHPVDSVDEDGEPFWSGTRRVPRALSFKNINDQSNVNDNLIGFVRAAGRLRLGTMPFCEGQSDISKEEAINAILVAQAKSHDVNNDVTGEIFDNVIDCLESTAFGCDFLQVTEFEKDDEQNGHITFITTASNLRAICYGIAPVDAMETRRVAGRIVPAMITTTAFVAALSCVELLKLLQDAPLKKHRNAFINLALPFFAFTAPVSAEKIAGVRGSTYTEWDRIVVKESKKAAAQGGITLQGLLVKIKNKLSVGGSETFAISSVSFGPFMIYASFLHEGNKNLLKQSLWNVIKDAVEAGDDDEFSGRDLKGSSNNLVDALDRKGFVDLSVVVDDLENDEEVQLPPVRFKRRLTADIV